MQTIWQFRFTVRFGIAEEDEEEDALLGPLSLSTFHHHKCRHFPRLCQFSAPFCPCHSLFSHSSRHLRSTAAVSLHTSDQCSWAVLSSAAVDDKKTFRRERKKKLLVKVRCSLATFAKRATICIVYAAAAAALNWTTLWTAIVKDVVCSHSLLTRKGGGKSGQLAILKQSLERMRRRCPTF